MHSFLRWRSLGAWLFLTLGTASFACRPIKSNSGLKGEPLDAPSDTPYGDTGLPSFDEVPSERQREVASMRGMVSLGCVCTQSVAHRSETPAWDLHVYYTDDEQGFKVRLDGAEGIQECLSLKANHADLCAAEGDAG